jgi:hypothetical protein
VFAPVGGYTPVNLDQFLQTGDLFQSSRGGGMDLFAQGLYAQMLASALLQIDPMALAQLVMMGSLMRNGAGGGGGCGCHLGGMGNRGGFSSRRSMSPDTSWGRSNGAGGTRRPGQPLPANAGITDRLYQAVVKQESGGNYRAVNPHSGALGIGQVMPANVRQWSKEALGYSITPQQFLNSPELQDKIIKHKLGQYYQEAIGKGLSQDEAVRYVASAWYSGSGERRNSLKPQGQYPTIRAYTFAVLNHFQNTYA